MLNNENKSQVPVLRFKGFTDAWIQEKLSNLYTFSNGINTSKDNYGTGRKMISVMDILSEKPLYYNSVINSVKISKEKEQTKKVNKGDILFVRSSETRSEVGWSKTYRSNTYALFSGFVIRGLATSNHSSNFIEYSLNFMNRSQIEREAEGSTRYNIGQNNLKNITLLLPSIEEQYKIVKLIGSLKNIITLEQEKLEYLLQIKQFFLQNMYNTKSNLDIHIYKLSEYIFKQGKTNKKNQPYIVSSVNNKDGFVKQSSQFENTRLDNLDKSTYRIVLPKEFAYNPSRINVGSIGFNDTNQTLIVSPLYIVLRLDSNIHNVYFNYYTQTIKFLHEVNRNTEGSVRKSLTFNNMKNINIPLPKNYSTQIYVANFFKKMDNIILSYEHKVEHYNSIKKYLLQNLFV